MKFTMLLFFLLSFQVFSLETSLDAKKSEIRWKGSKITGSHHVGKVFIKEGNIKKADGSLIGGKIIIDLKNFTVDDLKGEWATKFLSHMKSEDFFNISKHPTAKMEVISIKNNKAKAKLTIKGLTREVTFPIREVSGKFVGKLIFDRTKFGMIYGSGNFFKNLGDKVIKDEVEISFTLYPKT